MATPEFQSTEQDLDEVRYYTPLDPYYYAVDNRPLQDLGANSLVAVKGADASRRAVLMQGLANASVLTGLFGGVSGSFALGLNLTNPSTGVLELSRGAVILDQAVNSTDARTVSKIASLPVAVNIAAPHPVTAGKEVKYLVEIKYSDISGVSGYPYHDAANVLLPSTLLNGELKYNLVVGTEANTGLAVAPSATAGWTPLYNVTAVNGNSTATITRHASAPKVYTLYSSDNGEDVSWVTPTFSGTWVSTGGANSPASYRKGQGQVTLRGLIGSGAINTAAFTLPVGYRPTHTKTFAVSSNGAFGYVTVTSAGVVTPVAGAVTNVSLDGISFPLT